MRRVLVVGALSVLVVAAVPSATAQTRTVTSVIGSADGLFVDIEVPELTPLSEGEEVAAQQIDITFGPEPSVALPPTGGSVSEQVLDVDEPAGLISLTARVLTAAAEGALGPDGFATAESTVADLALGELLMNGAVGAQQLEDPILAAELISATCSADLEGVSGSTTLVGASVLGTALDVVPPPNTQLTIPLPPPLTGSVSVTLNRQTQNQDGSLSVAALVLDIAVDVGEVFSVTGTVEIGPATCGVVEGLEAPPAPAPVTAQVRFTG